MRFLMKIVIAAALLLLPFALCAPPASAANIIVTNNADSGAGSLRAAIDSASSGDSIVFSVYAPTTITLTSGVFSIEKNLTIEGDGNITISGNNANRIFYVQSNGTLTLKDLTLTHGFDSTGGGAIRNKGSMTATNCTFSENSASFLGGGIYNSGGTAMVSNCTFSGNSSAVMGGGIYNNSTLTVSNCTFSENSASNYGGAIFNIGVTAIVSNSTFSGNSAQNGGAIFNDGGGTLTISNCTLAENSASVMGGGIYNSGTLTVSNCTFSENSADSYGGGINNSPFGTCTARNCTFSGNSVAKYSGGGIESDNAFTGSNCIFWNNTPNSLGGNCTMDYSDIDDLFGMGSNISVDPLLGSLGNYGGAVQTFPLLPGSPCIDTGNSTGTPTTDARGKNRVGTVDMGAFESQGFILNASGGTPQTTKINTAFASPMSVSVTANYAGEPINGGIVTFMVPGAGASASITGGNTAIVASGAVNVNATANSNAGSYNVTASTTGGNSVNFSLANVVDPITFSKAFGAASIPLNGKATLTFTITNPNVATALSNIAFTDALPSGLVISTPNGLGGTLAANATAIAGSSSISLSGASLPAGGLGTVIVNVTGTTVGTKNNTTGNISSTESGTGETATASIDVFSKGSSGGYLLVTTSIPVVQTNDAGSITSNSVLLNGRITDNGNSTISEYGFLWGTSSANLTNKEKVSTDNTSSAFATTIKDLTPGTTYYYQAYTINGQGMGEGSIVSFATHSQTAPPVQRIVTRFYIGKPYCCVNDEKQPMDTTPLIVNDRTLLPIRYVAIPLGATVNWNDDEQKATITINGTTVELWIGRSAASVNGVATAIDPNKPNVTPILVPPGRSMVPLTFIAQSLGCEVKWDGSNQSVTISYGTPGSSISS